MGNTMPVEVIACSESFGARMSSHGIRVQELRIGVLLNESSGSCDAASEASLLEILRKAGASAVEVRCVESGGLEAALDHMAQATLDLLIVLGGDGTIRTAAEKCGAAGITLVALPGGTMNMLPHALYGQRNWQTALADTLANPRIVSVSGGAVGNHLFFCAGIFGSPSLWSGAREEIRENHLRNAFRSALHAYHRTFSRHVRYRFGDAKTGSSTAVAVLCPLISSALTAEAPMFEAVALKLNDVRGAFRLAWYAVFSTWRADPSVERSAVTMVTVSSRGRIPAILDGEAVQLPKAVTIRFAADCFKVLVPSEVI
jgi:diacylglycerol kinase family enzyme